MKTTPKPSATKNRSGDDVGPVPGVFDDDDIVVGDVDDAELVVVDASCASSEDGVALGSWVLVCVPSRPRL